jgi:DNA-binding winged helix-turn-helix (wHTH) protein
MPVSLEPKAFELLVYFIQHRGRLLEKQEILDAVWDGTFVSENALTRVVAQLRKALGDEAQESKYIETVPKRGYRFIAPVRKPRKPRAVSRRSVAVLVAAAVAVIAAAAMMTNLQQLVGAGDRHLLWSGDYVGSESDYLVLVREAA